MAGGSTPEAHIGVAVALSVRCAAAFDPSLLQISTVSQSASGRKAHLDGLRGVAALAVVFSHLQYFFVGAEYSMMSNPAPMPYFDGATAVCIFFILSGIVLWEGAAPRLPLAAVILKRYARLTVVILATSMLPLAMAIVADAQGAGIVDALSTNVPRWFVEATGGIYLTGVSAYNPPLWTMRAEFLGSLGVFIAARVMHAPALRLVAMVGASLIVVLYPTPTEAMLWLFAIGVTIRLNEHHLSALPSAWRTYGSIFAVMAALVLDVMWSHGIWISSILCVLAVAMPSPIQRLCASRVARWLGSISFALYLTHAAAVRLVLAGIPVPDRSGPVSSFLAASAALVLSLLLAVIFTAVADVPAIKLSHRLGALVSRKLVLSKA